jgi:hypothetical protein
MKDLFPVQVLCHSGYKADEYPTAFYWDTRRFEIEEILDRWYQGDQNPEFTQADYYKVRSSDQKIYILRHDLISDTWHLWIKGERLDL